MEGVISMRNLMMVFAALILALAISIESAEIYPEATFDEVTSSELDQSFESGEQLGWAEFDESEPERSEPKPIGVSPARPKFGKKKMGCTKKCRDKCVKRLVNKVPVLIGYCKKSCSMQCELRFMDRLYKCTIECADSMPPHFKKDPKRAEDYVEQCDMKCMKKHK